MHTIAKLIEPRAQIDERKKRFDNRALLALIVPIIIEQFLVLLVGIADSLMVSYAGEEAVSGVSLVDQLNNVFIRVFTALAAGGAVVASQYIGSKDRENGSKAASQLILITSLLGAVSALLVLVFGRQIFGALFGNVDARVLDAGLLYLRLSAWSYLFLAVYNACAGLYRSMGKTRELMFVSLMMNAINVAGNAIGIFALHAGVRGVAIPSLIARAFAAVVMLKLVFGKGNQIHITLKNLFAKDISMVRRILHIALPNGIEDGLFQLAKVALSSIVAMFGTAQIAAYGISQNFWAMGALFPVAMGPAFITVIGQYMGARDIDGANYYMEKLLRFTYAGGVVWSFSFTVISPLILLVYSLTEETRGLIILLIVLHNVFNALLAPCAFPLSSGLRAAGDVKFTMFAAIFSTVICRVAFSVLFGIILDMGVVGVTVAMVIDWCVKAALIFRRYRSRKWTAFRVI